MTKLTIERAFAFHAAHHLPTFPSGHPCRRLHGHTYRLVVRVVGEVGDDGTVLRFEDLDQCVHSYAIESLDHTLLNDRIDVPTAENVVLWIAGQLRKVLPGLSELGLFETPEDGVWLRVE